MTEEQTLIAFENTPIRRHFDEASETWYFSVVDVIAVLSESVNPRDYWFRMKVRVKSDDGLELSTICRQLKMKAPDGKMRATDCANVEGLLRIIQSIPSPKAEPFKQWLAKVGYERIQDMADPALSVDRARDYWQQHGRSEKWIQQRMMSQESRTNFPPGKLLKVLMLREWKRMPMQGKTAGKLQKEHDWNWNRKLGRALSAEKTFLRHQNRRERLLVQGRVGQQLV